MNRLRFVDLFAGLGGFNIALTGLGHRCVFASEIDPELRRCYHRNFGLEPVGDIRRIRAKSIPEHDVLCAGFPCQPFSKAGFQQGIEHPALGDLYRDMLRIIRVHHPRWLLIENVPNLVMHQGGQTWALMEEALKAEGYNLAVRTLSPHQFGIPQIRQRIYVVGSLDPLDAFRWPKPTIESELNIRNILDLKPTDARPIPSSVRACLDVWQEFLDNVPKSEKIPHPLWSMEFGATYPYVTKTPVAMSVRDLQHFRGSFGRRLARSRTREELFAKLPSHARRPGELFPPWKIRFIRRNRQFYRKHKRWLDRWKVKIAEFPSSYQKLEWNCLWDERAISKYIIQMRASGVRVKRLTSAPSLVAMTSTQLPIIGWENRYMTLSECKRLQCLEDLEVLPDTLEKACEALGNAINTMVAQRVARNLFHHAALNVGEGKADAISGPSVSGLTAAG